MNKKAFTLVELLAVIVILGILATVATTTIIKEVKKSKEKLDEAQITIVKSAAIEYAEKKGLFKKENATYNICFDDLKKEALIDDTIINSLDKNKNYYIKLTVKCDNICLFETSEITENKNIICD